ncbi:MAG: 50S ribosomal protein L21 [Candidatus Omnitrophica bacterium]|nr:50S ribosomal protein L21 [Candidatus Omnitrophota bacterium]
MYAIIDIGGRQEKIEKGSVFKTNRLSIKEGANTKLSNVLLAMKNKEYFIGKPYIKGASVECEVVSHDRAKKVTVFKFKRRKSYRRKIGHRQDLTVLKVKNIHV